VFEIDATKLHCLHELEEMAEVYSFCTSFHIEYFVFNFPFIAGEEDNVIAHKYLLLRFFSSASRLIRSPSSPVPNAKILLSLCNDQASRWDLERLAKSQFFVISNTWTFDCAEFSSQGSSSSFPYSPRRNMSREAFPLVNTVTFEFTCVS
jgi:hypothetical protein